MKLIVVTNDQMPSLDLAQTLVAIEPFIDKVILREKSKTDAELQTFIQTMKENRFDIKKIAIHGNPNLAAAVNINDIQVPGHGLPLPFLKRQFPELSFGKSVHSFEEAQTAAAEGANSILYGHLFKTASKVGLPPRGIDELQQITSSLNIPVYAIGGIQPNHIEPLRRINVAGIAVMSSIFNNENPLESTKSYYDAIHTRGKVK